MKDYRQKQEYKFYLIKLFEIVELPSNVQNLGKIPKNKPALQAASRPFLMKLHQ